MQPFVLAHLFALVKKQLHADTNAQNRQTRLNRIQQRPLQLLRSQIVNTVTKRPLPWQHNRPPTGQVRRVDQQYQPEFPEESATVSKAL